jgi:hypothetical protein
MDRFEDGWVGLVGDEVGRVLREDQRLRATEKRFPRNSQLGKASELRSLLICLAEFESLAERAFDGEGVWQRGCLVWRLAGRLVKRWVTKRLVGTQREVDKAVV